MRFAGHFPAPDFRAPKPDSKWHIGSDGKPSLQSTASLQFFLAFSDRTFSGPRPVVIFQHGLGSDKDSTWSMTDRVKSLNVAVIGIDAPEHGSRATPPYPPGQTDLVKATSDFFGLDLNKGSFDLGIARDNFRQMACDQLDTDALHPDARHARRAAARRAGRQAGHRSDAGSSTSVSRSDR